MKEYYMLSKTVSLFDVCDVYHLYNGREIGAYTFNVLKYVVRAGRKDPSKTVEDLEKALEYLNRLMRNICALPDDRRMTTADCIRPCMSMFDGAKLLEPWQKNVCRTVLFTRVEPELTEARQVIINTINAISLRDLVGVIPRQQ